MRIYAGYLFSRNLTLAVMLLLAMGLRARGMLNALVLLAAFVQMLDAGVDCLEGRWAVVPGAVVIGTLFFAGAPRSPVFPFWKLAAWRQNDSPVAGLNSASLAGRRQYVAVCK